MSAKRWFTIQNKADTSPVEILIYDQIGKDWFSNDGVSAKEFAEALAEIPKSRDIVVGINSPGGNVWDGLAIYHQLKARGDKVSTRIDGVAASIASVIALAGNLTMPANALMMIHRAWGMAVGNAGDMLKLADDLSKHDGVIAGIYSDKNGKSVEENLKAMEAETWFNGTEAKAFGLVDNTTDALAISASLVGQHDLSRFKNFQATGSGKQTQPNSAPVEPVAEISAAPCGAVDGVTTTPPVKQNKETHTMSQTATVTAELPTPAPANNADVIAAINALGDKLTKSANSLPGAEPITVAPAVQNFGNAAVERYYAMDHGKDRATFIKNNYGILARHLPGTGEGAFKAQSIDAGLANSLLSSEVVDTMRTLVAPLSAFTRQVEINPISPRQVINVPLASSAGSIQTNPSNFETGDTTQALIAVTVNQYSKSFFVAHAEQNSGLRLAQFAPTNAMVMGEGIVALVTALMTSGNFGSGTVIGAASSFDSADLPAILALGSNYGRVTLLLDGGHLAYLLPTTREHFAFGEPGAYGFDGGIYKNNLWTGALTNTKGFLAGPNSIVIATGQPANLPAGEVIAQSTVQITGGLSVTVSTWFSRGSRALWGSYDVMFGCKVGDGSQGECLITS